ncbi:metallophosphoesterase [Geomicrobium sp. JSM 1781026]|uniref:metallophosphoesterase n=1 Tax=Geomicrobium sp. JSM 1781026 TaxID=3344580 RepID=UPI0035BEF147
MIGVGALLFVMGIGLLVYMGVEAKRCRVREHQLIVAGQSQPVTLLFISDVHRRVIKENWVKKVIHSQVDVVIIGGDLLERGTPLSRTDENLRVLSQIADDVLFVYGNHDMNVAKPSLVRLFQKYGVRTLENEHAWMNEGSLHVFGTKDHTSSQAVVQPISNRASINVLVSHNPNVPRMYKDSQDYDLILSGHTHGGQIRIFGFGIREAGKWQPFGSGQLLISNGFGTRRLPLRLGAPAEVHLIRIAPPE